MRNPDYIPIFTSAICTCILPGRCVIGANFLDSSYVLRPYECCSVLASKEDHQFLSLLDRFQVFGNFLCGSKGTGFEITFKETPNLRTHFRFENPSEQQIVNFEVGS
jgi:hypothetical protein